MAYADALHIPYVALVGGNEIENHCISLKDMVGGEQTSLSIEQLIDKLK